MQEGFNITSILPLVFFMAIFYFLLIRPQQKQAKEHKDMLTNLEKGDKIITNGGLIAEVLKVEEDFFKIKLAEDNIVKLSKDYVASKVEA
jgi:preprotein translocase subunit YajC